MSWKYTRTCSDKNNCQISGLNIYNYPWENTGKTTTVKDPMGDLDRTVEIWKINVNGETKEFAVGEFLPGIYSFYLNTEDEDEASAPQSDTPEQEQPEPEAETAEPQQEVRHCKACGNPLSPDSLFCPRCGTRVEGAENTGATYEFGNYDKVAAVNNVNKDSQNPLAIAGFVVSLVSILLSVFGVVSIVGIVLSSVGLYNATNKGKTGKGLAIAGLVIGICRLVLTIAFIIFAVNYVGF